MHKKKKKLQSPNELITANKNILIHFLYDAYLQC